MTPWRFLLRAAIFFCFLSLVLIIQPQYVGAADVAVDVAGGGRNLVSVVLTAPRAARTGETVELTFAATPLTDAPDLRVRWQVAAGAALHGNTTESFGPVKAGQTVTSVRSITFPAGGIYKVAAGANFDLAPQITFGASGVLFFTVDRFAPRVSDMDPTAVSPMHSIAAAEVIATPSISRSASDDPCFSVSGTLVRIERPPATVGYSADQIVPVRNAWIEVSEEDILFDDTYADLYTDANGAFSTSFCDDDGVFDDELEIYIEINAEIYVSGHLVAEVEDSSYLDENYVYETSPQSSEGGSLTFNIGLDMAQSAVFNIADAALDAWTVWRDSGGENGGDAIHEEEAEIHWEPGYGDKTSYYYWPWGEMTIADDPSDPDAWDDSVIMHEWGHMADDNYSCDDNPGGDHKVNELAETADLAWGEGYPDYWQSAVKQTLGRPNPSFYLDMNGMEGLGISINLENYDVSFPSVVSVRNELAVAAALWDFIDVPIDGADTVLHGHKMIQEVYTSDTFESVAFGTFDDTCDFDTFMRAWVAAGKPADAATAATIMQNTGYTLSPALVARSTGADSAVAALKPVGPSNGIWWNRVTYVVDNSKSMAGPKFSAVKEVLGEAINDQADEPEGTEFKLETFNNSSLINQEVFAGQFYADEVSPAVTGLATSGANDPACNVWGLNALYRAILDQYGGVAWLFTDGDTIQSPSVDNLTQSLNERGVRASVALLGLCGAPDPPEDEHAVVQREGGMERALGTTADVPGGVVPYLLTAINSGGQFLFVDAAQAANAAAILRAQLTHSAGAGTWSDYVSDTATYRFDELASWEYTWIDAAGEGTDLGTPDSESYKQFSLPKVFPYYGEAISGYNIVRAYENGYLTIGGLVGQEPTNTSLPNPALPNNAIYPYWDDLEWELLCGRDAESCGSPGHIYTKPAGDWFAVEHDSFFPFGHDAAYLNFETQLNLQSGEIRFLYEDLKNIGAAGATIGLENKTGTAAVQVSLNTAAGASSGMGYKFIPAPPQPTRTYTVPVDALMDGVAFLLTGYDGSFEDLVVKYPSGAQVSCADTTNVLCLDLGLVQYVQADVDGRYGDWTAIVDAGPTGSGTYSFFSMAASAISVGSLLDHHLGIVANPPLQVNLGLPLPSKTMSGRFYKPNNEPFGEAFNLYDDGAHGDGLADDGVFGSDPYTPSGAGTAYLRVTGQFQGTTFTRGDPVPYMFQPVSLESLGDGSNNGGVTTLEFELTNLDTVEHTYFIESAIPAGWGIDGVFGNWTLGPGDSTIISAFVDLGAVPNDLPSGTTGVVTLTAVEAEQGVMTDTASATVTRRREPDEITIFNAIHFLAPGGDSGELEVTVLDEQGVAVADGTEVQMSAALGAVDPSVGVTQGGHFYVNFTSGNQTGTATVTAAIGGLSASTEIPIVDAPADKIELVVDVTTPETRATGANLTARVTDRYGEPLAGQMVRIGVEGDGQMGTVGDGQEVVEGLTDVNGEFKAVFTSGNTAGIVGIRAEFLVQDGPDKRVVHVDRKEINLTGGGASLFLPVIRSD